MHFVVLEDRRRKTLRQNLVIIKFPDAFSQCYFIICLFHKFTINNNNVPFHVQFPINLFLTSLQIFRWRPPDSRWRHQSGWQSPLWAQDSTLWIESRHLRNEANYIMFYIIIIPQNITKMICFLEDNMFFRIHARFLGHRNIVRSKYWWVTVVKLYVRV